MRFGPLIALSLIAACAGEADQADTGPAAPAGQAPPVPAPAAAPERQAAEQDPQAARAVLQRYFTLARSGRWDEAARLWSDERRAAAFAAELREFGEFQPSIAAPGRVEGAAGSIYVSISLQLLRDSRSGIEALSDGTAVLRRANDVPGSTAGQRQWRIDRITLQPPPVPAAS